MNKLSHHNQVPNLNQFMRDEPIHLSMGEVTSLPQSAIISIIQEKGRIISLKSTNNASISLHKLFDFYVLLTSTNTLNSLQKTYKVDYLNKPQADSILNAIFLDLR